MFGTGEIILILFLVLLLFGGKKLPELARSLGKGVKEFRNACQGIEEEEVTIANPEKKIAETTLDQHE